MFVAAIVYPLRKIITSLIEYVFKHKFKMELIKKMLKGIETIESGSR